jgi:tripartite-type tricarboxylate transporter receptor subunit TctC
MKLPRRKFLRLAAGTAALPAMSRSAWAQTYPSRPVRLIVGIPPSGGTDILARLFGQWLSEQLGQPFIIDNRPGAGGTIGTEVVVKAPPDGYTLLLANTANAINTTLYEKLNFNFLRDIAPVASLIREPLVMAVNPSLPGKAVSEFIAYAKANPGKITMASAGNGSSPHMAGELFKLMTGVSMLHVPYRGSAPALTDLLGGQVQVMFATMPSSIEHIRAGRLRALAVTTATRAQTLAEIATVGESVPGYEASAWYGVGAPKNTRAEIMGGDWHYPRALCGLWSDARCQRRTGRIRRQRRSESDLDPGAVRAVSGGHLDDFGVSIGPRLEHDPAISGNDGQRIFGRQDRASHHAQAVAERSPLREAQELA